MSSDFLGARFSAAGRNDLSAWSDGIPFSF
jgi:hypothetical protein